jgi:hypothetical protein
MALQHRMNPLANILKGSEGSYKYSTFYPFKNENEPRY